MKTKLLLLTFLISFSVSAQITHDLNWDISGGTNNDLTITSGDTVRWTWTSANHTVENTPGSSVETFNSGFLGPIGSTYEFTFTVVGDNHYFCGIHGSGNMAGTISVMEDLSIPEERVNKFSILPNPATSLITIKSPSNANITEIEIFNILGKRVLKKSLNASSETPIPISNWQSGLYIVRVTNGETTQIKRFVKL